MEKKQFTNDELVLQLKEKLAIKEKELEQFKVRFAPKTNCRIIIFDISYNLHVLNKTQLIQLLAYLQSQKQGLISFDPMYLTNFSIEGFHINDWIVDINNKIQECLQKDKQKEYDLVKKKLDNLLSTDKKTELELNEIANLLG